MEPPSKHPEWEPSIPRNLKILCSCAAALVAASAPAGAAGMTRAGRPARRSRRAPDLQRATLSQSGERLVLTVRSAAPLPLAKLDPLPSPRGGSPYLCLGLARAGQGGERRLCLGGASARRRAGLETLDATGEVAAKSTVAVRVKRAEPTKLAVALLPAAAGLSPHRYRWRVLEDRRGCGGSECGESLPASGERTFRLRPVRAVGCTGGGASEVFEGPRDRRVVALTFDDGPSEYTEGFLDALRREHVPGTFFEIGQEMAGRAATTWRILREGDEIGDHTMHHVEFPGYAEIAGAASRIEAYTHFRPCLFRPPGGAVNSSVVATAGGLGMETILWNVDPTDWATPGADAIYSRIVGATQPGSIVLMHDGGGNRSGTLAALPRVIDTLRARGYSFATVTGLLGHRILYRPYG
jgi:peptidoglycan/xylan/chitin deacetylase (PgdA/CDA1 family)